MADLLSYLPPFEGLLPKWLFLVSVVSTANSIQAYRSESYSAQLYNAKSTDGRPFTNPLSSRTFGTWTFLSSVVRMYAAYHLTTPAVYDLAMWSFGIALVHFLGELVAFGSAKLKGRFVSPLIVASSSLTWMWLQRDGYLSA
ncbi:hypothetical protein FE257_009964 [Aspergillus nanangensis]|uniref:Uncharacterized protein n=1 Tax=Aspergillus nanangensis TaxID=2582783 RepID=A0AAD4CW44_ASPNN|nr:hypothetical protein FE257_009964 [Aspergillus nanangensis]